MKIKLLIILPVLQNVVIQNVYIKEGIKRSYIIRTLRYYMLSLPQHFLCVAESNYYDRIIIKLMYVIITIKCYTTFEYLLFGFVVLSNFQKKKW